MDSINYSNIPLKKYGTSYRMDWKNSVGKTIPFTRGNITGSLEVLEHYPNNKILIQYNSMRKVLRTSKLSIYQFDDILDRSNQIILDLYVLPNDKSGNIIWTKCRGLYVPFTYYDICGNLYISNIYRKNNW